MIKASSIVLFFVALNVALYLVNQTQVIPSTESVQPIYTPDTISIAFLDVNPFTVGGSIAIVGVGILTGWLMGKVIYGASIAVLLFVADKLSGIVSWVFFGFPKFVAAWAAVSGDPTQVNIIAGAAYALMSVPFLWFLMGLVAQRPIE